MAPRIGSNLLRRTQTSTPAPPRTSLKPGSTGNGVKNLQERLKAHGFRRTRPTRTYDTSTTQQVENFQKAKIADLDRQIRGTRSDAARDNYSTRKSALQGELDQGVAGPATQAELERAPPAKPLAIPLTTAASPDLPNADALSAVGATPLGLPAAPASTTPAPELTAGLSNDSAVRTTVGETANLADSKRHADSLEQQYENALEHEREPDLTTAKDNLANHLENDYLPKLKNEQTQLGQQLFRASERGQDTAALQGRYDDNKAEIDRAEALLDRAQGKPVTAQSAGVLDPGIGFDLQNPPANYEAKVLNEDGTFAQVSVQAKDGESLGPNGEQMRNLEISRTALVGVGVEAEAGVVSGRAEAFGGAAMNYSVSIPEEHYQKVLRGEAPFPNPGDLSTLPPGSTAMVRAEDVVGTELEGSYRALEVGSRIESNQGTAVGIQVLDEDNVRVMAGPTGALANSTAFGLGFEVGPDKFKLGGKVELGATEELRGTELKFVDIDRQTGGDAYAEFLRTGEVPSADEPGVGRGGTISSLDYNHEVKVGGEVSLGGFEFGGTLLNGAHTSSNQTVVEFNDGSVERSTTQGYSEGASLFLTERYDREGELVDRQQGLLLDDVDESYADAFGEALGTGPRAGTFDAQIEFASQADYDATRERALQSLTHQGVSQEHIDLLRQGPDADGLFGGQVIPMANPVVTALIRNENPEDFFNDQSLRFAHRNVLAEGFIGLHEPGDAALPIDAETYAG